LKNLAAIIAYLLVGYGGCARSYAQGPEPSCSPSPDDPKVTSAARALVHQLRAAKAEDRERVATALQAMGSNSAKALTDYLALDHKPFNEDDILAATKAVTVLAKIGTDVGDDCRVTNALLLIAELNRMEWPLVGLRLAAIEALGEINKYRGGILTAEEENAEEKFDLSKAIAASDELAKIAEQVFASARARGTPTPAPASPDHSFYTNLKYLQDSQTKLVKLAAQVNAAAPFSNKKKPVVPKLADANSLATSLRKIMVGYSDATKTIDVQKLKLENTYDKTAWQFQTEAAYDLESEVMELKTHLDALNKAVSTVTKNRDALKSVISRLATISDQASGSNFDQIRIGVAGALNATFSKPPKEKPVEKGTKKDSDKKDSKEESEKKDANKKESTNNG
jgi:hypothetical protein